MNKYANKKKKCFSGHLHASRLEANHCNSLLADKQAGKIKGYYSQYPFVLIPGQDGEEPIKHIVDFLVMLEDWAPIHGLGNCVEVHECKGYPTEVWRIKRRLFKQLYPHIPYKTFYRGGEEWTKAKKKEFLKHQPVILAR